MVSYLRIYTASIHVFAMKYNKTFNYIGHVFYDRFKSVIINDFRRYIATFVDIMENSVRAGIVEQPQDFEIHERFTRDGTELQRGFLSYGGNPYNW